jgi:hypothetical protein
MAQTLISIILDATTGQVIERPLTAEEIAEYKIIQEQEKTRQTESQAKANARQSALAKLADLGLTQDEINAL